MTTNDIIQIVNPSVPIDYYVSRIDVLKEHQCSDDLRVNLSPRVRQRAHLWSAYNVLCSKSPKNAWHVEVIAEDSVVVLMVEDVAKAIEIMEAEVVE
jgi:hypothetical protein